jgi:hypothetical protein
MAAMYYVLGGDGEPRSVGDDAERWARWLERHPDQRRVEVTTVDRAEVSTVFLGINHQFGEGPPLIFETMIFGGRWDQCQWRWTTRAQSLAGHDQVVAALRAGNNPNATTT